jgi:hypothetical protein
VLSILVDSVKNDAFKVAAKPTAPDLTIMHLLPFQETDLKPTFVRKTSKAILFRSDGCRAVKVSRLQHSRQRRLMAMEEADLLHTLPVLTLKKTRTKSNSDLLLTVFKMFGRHAPKAENKFPNRRKLWKTNCRASRLMKILIAKAQLKICEIDQLLRWHRNL